MATGQSRWAELSAVITKELEEGAEFTMRQLALLISTVRNFNDTSNMWARKNTEYSTANPRVVDEGEDVVPTQFNRSALSTLTPYTYADQFFLTDQRIRSDVQDVVTDAAMEQGSAFAVQADEAIAAHFASLTGGTIGAAAGTLTWSSLINGRAMMQTNKIPPPYYCALHPYQWAYLLKSIAPGATVTNAPQFSDRLINAFFQSSMLGGVTIVVTPSIAVDSDNDAIGAMYNPLALAYDLRQPFRVVPEYDASRRGVELNFNTDYATGVWVPARGIQLIGDAATPST
jgi:hypothetical protein